MTDLSLPRSGLDTVRRANAAALALLALTAVHHVYGAVAFETPWRLHVLALVLPAAIAIFLTLRAGMAMEGRSTGRRWAVIGALLILVVPVALIGFYEGGYNHLVKNLAYFLGGEARALALFPPPTYEMPRDVFFEVTGIAQFPLSIVTGALATRLLIGAAR